MNISNKTRRVWKSADGVSISSLAFALVLAGSSLTAQAGLITSDLSDSFTANKQSGFGGLEFTNIDVVLNDFPNSTFNVMTGEYFFSVASDHTYEARVYDDDVQTTLLGKALAKDWPVGEPVGIKIVNDDTDVKEGRATNCIMSTSYLDDHFLDTADPKQVICSGPFQSHKRYKLAMLPTTVAGGPGAEKGIDLVFNVEQDGTSRDYQVFQKINNWTDKRLAGFTIQVGTGQGASFVPASDTTTGVGVANLSLSVPVAVWGRTNQNANFSTGLFGPRDVKHDRPHGYFDPDTRAGFVFNEYGAGKIGDASGQTDTLTSGPTLGSDYDDVPAGALAAAGQFGNWLPNSMLPFGIFYDEDANPDTDNLLVAWYGHHPTIGGLRWMTGVDTAEPVDPLESFKLVAPETITTVWANDPLYSMAVIDDLVNVGLNYNVTIADISSFPGYDADPALNAATFTIRITPVLEAVATPAPAYVDQIPDPSLAYLLSNAIINLTPFPESAIVDEFVPGSVLTVGVGDADLNLIKDPADPDAIESATIVVSTAGDVVPSAPLTLTELGPDRGVFAANLPSQFSDVAPGTVVTVTYNDASGPGDITASLTASGLAPPGTLQFTPVDYTVEENEGSIDVLVTRTGGDTGEVAVEYQTVSGTAIGGEDYITDAGNVTFADGDAVTKTVTVMLINDTAAELDKSFSLLLSNAQGGATLGAADTATVSLTDNDVAPPGSLQFNPVSYEVARNGGSITLTVERVDGKAGEATVDYLTLAGTAHGGEDYVVQTGTLTFANGSTTSQPITVQILNDGTADGDEVFTIQLSNVTVADMGAADLATVTIDDTLVYYGTSNDGLFSFSWMTIGLVIIGLLARAGRKPR